MHEKSLEDSLPQSDTRRPTFYLYEQAHIAWTSSARAAASVPRGGYARAAGREEARPRRAVAGEEKGLQRISP